MHSTYGTLTLLPIESLSFKAKLTILRTVQFSPILRRRGRKEKQFFLDILVWNREYFPCWSVKVCEFLPFELKKAKSSG